MEGPEKDKLQPLDDDQETSATSAADKETLAPGRRYTPTPREASHDPEALLPVGGYFGPYRIVRLLGKGGMGEVYEAEHMESDRRVALKVLGQALGSSEDRQRFLREGKLAAQVSHPHCVYIYGTEEIDGILVISMELVTGGTLKDRVDTEGPLAISDAVDAVLQMIDGLEAAASQGVLHRDIKPANCFLDSDGSVKIGDFGLSISTFAHDETQLTTAGTVLGTPAYASPEQLKARELDVRSDIYSVGATLYWLLTGETPFTGRNVVEQIAQIMGEAPRSPGELRPEVPAGLAKVALRCLEKEPAARFGGYAELRAALEPFGSAELAPAPLGRRFAAGVVDFLVVLAIVGPVEIASFVLYHSLTKPQEDLIRILLLFTYYALLEGTWGASLGKTLFGLRLAGKGSRKPGFARAALRAFVFLAFFEIPTAIWGAAAGAEAEGAVFRTGEGETTFGVFMSYADNRYQLLAVVLFLVMFSTARRKNGFTGLHGIASGTRVVSEARSAASVEHQARLEVASRSEPFTRMGPYEVIGEIWADGEEQLLLGFDQQLDRKAWIHVVPPGTPPVPASRRDVSRPTRLRWLSGKRGGSESWDAYEWVEGTTLASLLACENTWAAVRRWLLDIGKELERFLAESENPTFLKPERIWIAADGTAKLLDFAPEDGAVEEPQGFVAAQQRLHQFATAALGDQPLPLHARALLDDLAQGAFEEPAQLVERLGDVAGMQPVVPRRVRLAHFAWWSFPPLMMTFLALGALLTDASLHESPGIAVLLVLVNSMVVMALAIPSLITATVLRGGVLFRLTGVAVVNREGQVIPRYQAFCRSFVAWSLALVAAVITFTHLLRPGGMGGPMAGAAVAFLLLMTMLAGAIWCIIVPERGPQDHLARTYLVPR